MKTRMTLIGVLCVLAATFPLAGAEKPNIIFILTDDLGYGDVGVLFQKQREGVQVLTPELDEMAGDDPEPSLLSCPDLCSIPGLPDHGDAPGAHQCAQHAVRQGH